MIDVRCGERLIGISSHPIRVEPRMQLHVAGMTLLDHILQRVHNGSGATPCFPVRYLLHGSRLRTIKGIGRRAHLKNNRIDTDMLQTIQHLVEIVLHRIDSSPCSDSDLPCESMRREILVSGVLHPATPFRLKRKTIIVINKF